MEKKKILTLRRILVTVFLIVCAVIAYINFRGSYLEYKELGENYLQTFLTKEKYYYRVFFRSKNKKRTKSIFRARK